MENVLLEKLKRLQNRLVNLENHLDKFEHSDLNRPPAPDKWSAVQIVWHLYKSESLSVSYLKKKLAAGPYPRAGISSRIRSLLLKWALASPLKFQAPSVVRANMPDNIDKNRLIADFHQTREELHRLLDEFPPHRMNEGIYKHPRIGYININQTMDFLYWHFTHHEKQILAITPS